MKKIKEIYVELYGESNWGLRGCISTEMVTFIDFTTSLSVVESMRK